MINKSGWTLPLVTIGLILEPAVHVMAGLLGRDGTERKPERYAPFQFL